MRFVCPSCANSNPTVQVLDHERSLNGNKRKTAAKNVYLNLYRSSLFYLFWVNLIFLSYFQIHNLPCISVLPQSRWFLTGVAQLKSYCFVFRLLYFSALSKLLELLLLSQGRADLKGNTQGCSPFFKAQTWVWENRNNILDIYAELTQKTVFEQWVLSWNSYLRISSNNCRKAVAFFYFKSTGMFYENWAILPGEKGLIFSGLAGLMRNFLDSQIWLTIVV